MNAASRTHTRAALTIIALALILGGLMVTACGMGYISIRPETCSSPYWTGYGERRVPSTR